MGKKSFPLIPKTPLPTLVDLYFMFLLKVSFFRSIFDGYKIYEPFLSVVIGEMPKQPVLKLIYNYALKNRGKIPRKYTLPMISLAEAQHITTTQTNITIIIIL